MRHISLEVPLRPFALARRRQSHHAANPRIETLSNSLDHSAFARSITTLEDNDDLELAIDHPVLQLDQFALQAKQFPKIKPPIDKILGVVLGDKFGEPRVIKLHLELFIDAVDHLAMQTNIEGILTSF